MRRATAGAGAQPICESVLLVPRAAAPEPGGGCGDRKFGRPGANGARHHGHWVPADEWQRDGAIVCAIWVHLSRKRTEITPSYVGGITFKGAVVMARGPVAIARVARCSAESARAPFYKEAPTVPAPRRAHECPMSSAGAVRCCCAFLRARLAPLTTAHRQGLEKLGNRGRGRGALPSLRLRAPLACIACIKTRDAPTDICTVPQAACYCCCAWATIHSAPIPTQIGADDEMQMKTRDDDADEGEGGDLLRARSNTNI